MSRLPEPTPPSAGDLSETRFLTVMELEAARDALVDAVAKSELDEDSIRNVFALLLDGGGAEPGP